MAGDPRDRQPYAESLGEVQEIVDTCDFFTVRAAVSTARPICKER